MSSDISKIIRIQKSYFSLLKDCFHEQYLNVRQADGDSEKGILDWGRGKFEDEIVYKTKRRLEDIEGFWKQNLHNLQNELISLDLLPAYSVSRPLYLKKQITAAGLYCDLFVCHDDSISALRNYDALPKDRLVSLSINLLRDFMDLISLENVFLPDSQMLLSIICPGERDFSHDIEINLIKKGKSLTIAYANDLLGSEYSSWEELEENTKMIVGSQAIKRAIKRPELLPAPFAEPKKAYDRLSQCFERLRIIHSQSKSTTFEKPVLSNLLTTFLTEFAVMESQIHGSLEVDSAPLLPRYTWDLYKWRISSGNMDSTKILGWEERQTTAVVTSFQHENLDWLCNLPLNSVIELRKSGFLEDFREKIRLARKRLTIKEGVDFEKISKEINKDIEGAITEHKDSIKKLEHEAHERIGMETTRFIGKMWFAIASCFVPVLSLLSFMGEATEYALKIKDDIKVLTNIPERFKRGSWGILLETKQKNSKKQIEYS